MRTQPAGQATAAYKDIKLFPSENEPWQTRVCVWNSFLYTQCDTSLSLNTNRNLWTLGFNSVLPAHSVRNWLNQLSCLNHNVCLKNRSFSACPNRAWRQKLSDCHCCRRCLKQLAKDACTIPMFEGAKDIHSLTSCPVFHFNIRDQRRGTLNIITNKSNNGRYQLPWSSIWCLTFHL